MSEFAAFGEYPEVGGSSRSRTVNGIEEVTIVVTVKRITVEEQTKRFLWWDRVVGYRKFVELEVVTQDSAGNPDYTRTELLSAGSSVSLKNLLRPFQFRLD